MGGEAAVRILILGAAGRDFHNFNVVYRDDPAVQVVAFTAAQIPDIAGRRYPPQLAGPRYPEGIPVVEEQRLEALTATHGIEQVVFAYSDVSHQRVMHTASRVLAAGADFLLLGPGRTMLRSPLPVIAVSAVRTGCGKSPVSRWIARRLRGEGLRVGVLRHPMPYGDLLRQRAQRFSSVEDLSAARCSVEEREEYEPHLREGSLVYAGVDYAAVLAMARDEVDIIVWDGGNNDFPLLRPDLHLVLVDPLRPRDGQSHHPGEAVLRMADTVLVTKSDVATAEQLAEQAWVLRAHCPGVPVIHCELAIEVDAPERITGRRVLVVEDGPTLTHGGDGHRRRLPGGPRAGRGVGRRPAAQRRARGARALRALSAYRPGSWSCPPSAITPRSWRSCAPPSRPPMPRAWCWPPPAI
ncbi:MAG: GTPase [Candidatus Sedimenticola endophacoides]